MFGMLLTLIAALGLGQPDANRDAAEPAARTIVPAASAAPIAVPTTPLPPIYAAWLAREENAVRVADFEAELATRNLLGIVPTHELLRTAIDWERCGAEAFELPERSYWGGAFASLAVIRDELAPVLGKIEIVSGYRHAALNDCAGGAPGSVHREFGAFDAYVRAPGTREAMVTALCDWHRVRGPALAAGLGIYRERKFHIDVGLRGFRSWGSDYRRTSSPCA